MDTNVEDIDSMIRQEKKLLAGEHQEEAWADARLAGIEPEIVAEAAIEIAFLELVAEQGEDIALKLLDSTRDKVLSGGFQAGMIRH